MELDGVLYGAIYGKEAIKLGELKSITCVDDDINADVLSISYCNLNKQREFIADFSADISAEIRRIIDSVSSRNYPDYQVEELINRIQKRKHKKRRINKKWAKRYGYWDVVLKGRLRPDVSIEYSEDANVQWQGTIDNVEVVVKDV